MPQIFLDESGQFISRDSQSFFVVGSFTVGDPRRTEKQYRAWCRRHFPKKCERKTRLSSPTRI